MGNSGRSCDEPVTAQTAADKHWPFHGVRHPRRSLHLMCVCVGRGWLLDVGLNRSGGGVGGGGGSVCFMQREGLHRRQLLLHIYFEGPREVLFHTYLGR